MLGWMQHCTLEQHQSNAQSCEKCPGGIFCCWDMPEVTPGTLQRPAPLPARAAVPGLERCGSLAPGNGEVKQHCFESCCSTKSLTQGHSEAQGKGALSLGPAGPGRSCTAWQDHSGTWAPICGESTQQEAPCHIPARLGSLQ